MTSGVYQLTFSNGDTYIGKSVNIQNRWKQHFDKMTSGKAAANMQHAYYQCGVPEGAILHECHEDHIDILEACYIARVNPTLNSTRPKDPWPDLYGAEWESIVDVLHVSTLEHVRLLRAFEKNTAEIAQNIEIARQEYEHEFATLENQLAKCQRARSDEELAADIEGRIEKAEEEVRAYKLKLLIADTENQLGREELLRLRRPWWKKIFS